MKIRKNKKKKNKKNIEIPFEELVELKNKIDKLDKWIDDTPWTFDGIHIYNKKIDDMILTKDKFVTLGKIYYKDNKLSFEEVEAKVQEDLEKRSKKKQEQEKKSVNAIIELEKKLASVEQEEDYSDEDDAYQVFGDDDDDFTVGSSYKYIHY